MAISYLEQITKHTIFSPNPLQDQTGLHPAWTALDYGHSRDPFEALDLFREQVCQADDYDDGDWKRQITSDLAELKQNMSQQAPWILQTIENMRSMVNWFYREDLENIRAELLKRADGIRKGLIKLS